MHRLTIQQLSAKLRSGELTSREVTAHTLERIKQHSHINAYITVDENGALAAAESADALLATGKDCTPLTGIPVAVKDNICIEGLPATSASKMLENYYPPYSALVAEKLKQSGAVILGKTNMDEFAMGTKNETSYFGRVLNPVNTDCNPGGSSGGSAAAVAAGLAYAALGTDTGGSIRQPAAFCGVVGIKPTYGTVSRYGITAFSSSLDQAGVLGRSVYDTALVLRTISGYDCRDATSHSGSYPALEEGLSGSVKGKRVGIAKESLADFVDEDIKQAYTKAVKEFEAAGADIVEVSVPHIKESLSVYLIIACAEASSNLARLDGIKYGYRSAAADNIADLYTLSRTESLGAEVKRRIMLGNYVLSSGYYDAFYLKAQKARTVIINELKAAFSQCDFMLTPTTPYTAKVFGHKFDDPIREYYSDVFTVMTNIAGVPSVSVPCGKNGEGMPIGLQIIGPPLSEQSILDAAYFYEQAEGHKWITK